MVDEKGRGGGGGGGGIDSDTRGTAQLKNSFPTCRCTLYDAYSEGFLWVHLFKGVEWRDSHWRVSRKVVLSERGSKTI